MAHTNASDSSTTNRYRMNEHARLRHVFRGCTGAFPSVQNISQKFRTYLNDVGDGFVTQNNTARSVRVSKHRTPGCEYSL